MILKCPSCEFFWQANCEDECNIDCIELTSYTDGRVLSTLPSIDDNAFFYCKRCHYVCWRRDVRTSDQDCRLTFSAKLFLRREARPPAEVVLTLLPGDDVVTELMIRLEAWRLSNDGVRHLFDSLKIPPSRRPEWWQNNMQAIISIFANTDGRLHPNLTEDLIQSLNYDDDIHNSDCATTSLAALSARVLSEVYREIGMFEKSVATIESLNDELNETQLNIKATERWSRLNNPYVQQL